MADQPNLLHKRSCALDNLLRRADIHTSDSRTSPRIGASSPSSRPNMRPSWKLWGSITSDVAKFAISSAATADPTGSPSAATADLARSPSRPPLILPGHLPLLP
ncbi:hypothetical protein SLA2020_494030 [Shorea laevis]